MSDPCETGDEGVPAPTAGCRCLQDLASDVRLLMRQHCPLCQGTGPNCIVESLQDVLDEAEAPERTQAALH